MCKEAAVPSFQMPSGQYAGGTEETQEQHGRRGNKHRTSSMESKRADSYRVMGGDLMGLSSPYRAVSTLRLSYKNQSVNAV